MSCHLVIEQLFFGGWRHSLVRFWCALLLWTLELPLLLRFRLFVKGKQTLCSNVQSFWFFGLWLEPQALAFKGNSLILNLPWDRIALLASVWCSLMVVLEFPCRDWAALQCILLFCHLVYFVPCFGGFLVLHLVVLSLFSFFYIYFLIKQIYV